MLRIILTILLVGAFFILFFKPNYNLKNKTDLGSVATDTGTGEVSTTDGFVEDTQGSHSFWARWNSPKIWRHRYVCCLFNCSGDSLVKWISAKGCE